MCGPFTVKKKYLIVEITISRAWHSYWNMVQVKFEDLNQLCTYVKEVKIYCTVLRSVFYPLSSTGITLINRKFCSQLQQMWILLCRLLHVTSCFINLHNCISNTAVNFVSFLDIDILYDVKFIFSYGTSGNLCWQRTADWNGKYIRGKQQIQLRVFFNVLVSCSGLCTECP